MHSWRSRSGRKMSNRERIRKLEHGAAIALEAKQNLEQRITRLECEHSCGVVFKKEVESSTCWFNTIKGKPYRKECSNCGKVLQAYDTKMEWLNAQLEIEKGKVKP